MKIKKISSKTAIINFPQLTGSDGEDGGEGDNDLSNRIANGDSDGVDDDDNEGEGGEGEGEDDAQDRKLAREAAKRRRENNKLKKELEELKAEREQQELSRKSKLEQAQHKLNEAKQTNDNLSATNERLLIENAILKDNKRTWHDSSAVIALLDKSTLEVDPVSGNIDGIEEALAELAKDKPFLMKTGGSTGGSGASGSQPQGNSNTKQTKTQKENELRKKWKL